MQAAGLALGKSLLNQDIEQAFAEMDTDGNGCVDFDEFVGWWWREGKLSAVDKLDRKWKQFGDRFDQLTANILVAGGATKLADRQRNLVVLEVGAGVVVSSIRSQAEHLAAAGYGLIRINPSADECAEMQTSFEQKRFHPVVARSNVALAAIAAELGLE